MSILICEGLCETNFGFLMPFSLSVGASGTTPVSSGTPNISFSALTPASMLTANVDTWDWKGQGQGVPAFDIIWVEDGIDTAVTANTFSATLDGRDYSFKVRARNDLGETSPWYVSVAVSITADTVAPTVTSTAINTSTDQIDLAGVSEPGTYYAIINYSATALTGSDIVEQYTSGVPDAEISFAVVVGANNGAIDKSLVPPGTAYLHGTVKDAAGNYSTDVPLAFTQPAPFYADQNTNSVELAVAANQVPDAQEFSLAGWLKSSGTGATIHRIAKNGKCWIGYFPSTTEFYVSLKNAAGTKFYEAYYNTMDLIAGKHIIFAVDANNVGLWVDGVEQTASNVLTAFTTGNTMDLSPAWDILSDPATQSLKAGEVGQFIMDNTSLIDFTSAATKAASVKQIYNGGVLKDFANLPVTPKVALGDTMVLADWNKATNVVENLGSGTDPARTNVFA